MAIRVIGVGDNVVDKYMHTKTMYPGGNAFNFSAYASMLGASSSYMGVFGSDEAAQLVQATANSWYRPPPGNWASTPPTAVWRRVKTATR